MTNRYQKNPSASCPPSVPQRDEAQNLDTFVPGYLSASQIAALELPGLPTSKRGVNRRAERDGWTFVDRAGRGGGRLFRTSDLPAQARNELFERRADLAEEQAKPVGRPRGTNVFDRNPELAAAVEKIVATRGLAAPRIREMLAGDFAELPSLRTLQRFIAKLEKERPAVIASHRDPDGYRGRFRVALGNADRSVTYAHEVWELDTTKADVHTKGGRKMVLGVIDRWSRRARFLVVPSESGQSVRRLLVDTIRAWGVMPAAVMTDNGAGFINASIKSALEALGIEHRICPPGTPENKPFVERVFGTFNRERAEILAGYAGHSVADAQELRARAKKQTGRAVIVPEMTSEELQDVLDAWTDGVYHQRRHSALRMSPIEKSATSPVPAERAPAESTLRIALSALVGTRTVGKKGVRWRGGRYWSPACAQWMGREVVVRRDEDDLGALFLFSEEGEFIDTAMNAERAGMSDRDFAMAAKRDQDDYMRRERADLRRRSSNFSIEDARDQLLRRDAEAAGKLAVLPVGGDRRSTPAIDSIETASAVPAPEHPKTPAAPVTAFPKTARQKMREADAMIAAHEAGETVDPADLRRAELYRTTSEYRVERELTEYFDGSGPDAVTSASTSIATGRKEQ